MMKRQENTGSARYVARYIALGRVTCVVIVFTVTIASFSDASAAFGDTSVAVVNHVAFVRDDHHHIIVRGEGSTDASMLSSTHRARSPRTACGTGAMAASKAKSRRCSGDG